MPTVPPIPEPATWYLATTLPQDTADLTEIVRLYGLRNGVEQQDKQGKGPLGWSQYQVRADRAMRRLWALLQGAFALCWWAETRASSAAPLPDDPRRRGAARRVGEGGTADSSPAPALAQVARGAAAGAGLVGAGVWPLTLLARLERPVAATRPASPAGLAALGIPLHAL